MAGMEYENGNGQYDGMYFAPSFVICSTLNRLTSFLDEPRYDRERSGSPRDDPRGGRARSMSPNGRADYRYVLKFTFRVY